MTAEEAGSELVLALADFGKHLPGRLARQADQFRYFGKIGAQERIRSLLLAHQGWDRHCLGGNEFCYLLVALQQKGIVGLDGLGKTDIGGGIFVTTKNA